DEHARQIRLAAPEVPHARKMVAHERLVQPEHLEGLAGGALVEQEPPGDRERGERVDEVPAHTWTARGEEEERGEQAPCLVAREGGGGEEGTCDGGPPALPRRGAREDQEREERLGLPGRAEPEGERLRREQRAREPGEEGRLGVGRTRAAEAVS